MAQDNPEDAMTFGELLEIINEQQRRLTVLENAFSLLPFCLDDRANQLLIQNLRLEGQNQNRDELLQKHFSHLADEMVKRLAPPTAQLDNSD